MRKLFTFALAFSLAVSSANAAGVLAVMMGGRSFTPITHTYLTGSGNETIPIGAGQVVITTDGGGGGGSCANAGGPGGRAIKTILISPSDWSQTVTYLVAAGGIGGSTLNGGTNGGASTSTGTLAAGSFSLSGNGGGHGTGGGTGSSGTATGGDSNITGGGAAGGAGSGDCVSPVAGDPGHSGQVTFQYT